VVQVVVVIMPLEQTFKDRQITVQLIPAVEDQDTMDPGVALETAAAASL
jgi:hypothetical protein